jgi:hypothetical protein
VERIRYVQAPFTEREIERLLRRAKSKSKKEALRKAVLHYVNCPYDVEGDD